MYTGEKHGLSHVYFVSDICLLQTFLYTRASEVSTFSKCAQICIKKTKGPIISIVSGASEEISTLSQNVLRLAKKPKKKGHNNLKFVDVSCEAPVETVSLTVFRFDTRPRGKKWTQ